MRFCGFVRLVRIVESHIRSVGTSFLAVPFMVYARTFTVLAKQDIKKRVHLKIDFFSCFCTRCNGFLIWFFILLIILQLLFHQIWSMIKKCEWFPLSRSFRIVGFFLLGDFLKHFTIFHFRSIDRLIHFVL